MALGAAGAADFVGELTAGLAGDFFSVVAADAGLESVGFFDVVFVTVVVLTSIFLALAGLPFVVLVSFTALVVVVVVLAPAFAEVYFFTEVVFVVETAAAAAAAATPATAAGAAAAARASSDFGSGGTTSTDDEGSSAVS